MTKFWIVYIETNIKGWALQMMGNLDFDLTTLATFTIIFDLPTNLVIAGFELLLPVGRVPLHALQSLGQLFNLGPEVGKVPVLDNIRPNSTAHFSLQERKSSKTLRTRFRHSIPGTRVYWDLIVWCSLDVY